MAELPMSCPPRPRRRRTRSQTVGPARRRARAAAQGAGLRQPRLPPSCLRVVRHRIIQRLAVLGVDVPANADGVAAYAALERTAAEDAALDGLLRINFTQWNRNHVFDFLQAQVFRRVADAARGAGDAVVRAWCAGCSTGQEPYALAAYWRRWASSGAARGWAASATSPSLTDLDGDSLAVARAGRYRLEIASPGDNAASVDSFSDLPEDARRSSPGFMYLARAERAKLLEAIHAATADQGFLVVGHDERLPAGGAPLFEPVFEEWGVYRRLAAEAAAVDDDDDDERSDDGATFRALYDDSAALDGLRRERRRSRKVADAPEPGPRLLGPVGIYAIDARYVVIADSNFNALLVVDAKLGGAVGALSWPLDKNGTRVTAASDPQTWVSLTGVASCPTCGFATSPNHGAEFWRVSLPEPLAAMAARRDFAGLGNASVAPLALVVDGANLTHSGKLRMVRVSADGSAGYVAHLSRGVFAFDPRRTGAAMPAKRILEADGAAGSSSPTTNELATTMGAVLVLKTRNASAAPRAVKVQSACNGHHARDAVKADGLFYVISGPQQGAGCKGLFEVGEACRLLTARTRSVNWVDGPYSAAHFSRPHAMTRLPGTDLIALTDIDNRAVRLYAFRGPAKGEVTTVPYDDGLWRRLLGGAPRPRPARPQVGAARRR
ncbi:hypothetical protein JL720_1064 [Aureococcus anophagefferens]|nr:hypothetical protein JL720_1064 [Aureococcus anophagefferens]